MGTSTHHSNGHLGWGDYDGDGDLDLALAGDTVRNANPVARIYENNGNGNLTWDTEQDLVALGDASVAWGDYDNDGDLDLVIIGSVSPKVPGTPILYRNDPLGTLTPDPEISLAAMCGGSADWGDHDNDGDLDLLFLGFAGPTTPKTVIHENDPVGTLTNIGGLGLPQLARGDAEWGDYDNDGDLDLAITGDGGGWTCARVYRNNDGAGFTKVFDGFSANYSSCAWGDYDNDGDLDVGFCGGIDAGRHSMIYENTGGSFVHAFELQPMRRGSTTWADVDQDGDLDFFLTGNEDGVSYYARLYENIGHPPNTPPSPPTESHQEWTADGLLLSWSGASDAETPTAGLYYCLRVGTSPGAHDIMSGTYGTPLMGNVGQMTEIVLDVPAGQYDWSVLAIDSGFMASEWACAPCIGDIYEDGEVNTVDLHILLGDWGDCPDPPEDCPSDLDGNGTVNTADLLLLLANWGPCE